jgi:small subunit ribosomal protein S25e
LTIQKDSSSFIRGIFFSQTMGGSKKPTAVKKDKPKDAKDSKKGKKGEGGPRRAEIVVSVNEQEAMKIIQNSKVVTIQDLARQTGVKISAANAFLRESASKGTIKRVGGYSGHHLYQVVSS